MRSWPRAGAEAGQVGRGGEDEDLARRGRGSGPRPRRSSAGSARRPRARRPRPAGCRRPPRTPAAAATAAGLAVSRLPRAIVRTPGVAAVAAAVAPAGGRRRHGVLLVVDELPSASSTSSRSSSSARASDAGAGSPSTRHGAGAGPVQVLGELLDDVLPELVERAADADPGVLAGPADEGVDAQPQGADLGLGHQLGDGLELPVSSSSSSSSSSARRGVEALGQPADDVDRRGELLDRPAVGVLGGDVVDAVEVEPVVVVRGQVSGAEPRHDRPDRVVGEVVVGGRPAERGERGGGGEQVDAAVGPGLGVVLVDVGRRSTCCRGTPATPRRPPPRAAPRACSRCGRRG